MNVFVTLVIPSDKVTKAVEICDALGYPDKGMFTAQIDDAGVPVAYIATGIVDSGSPVLADAAILWAAVKASSTNLATLADCQSFKEALEETAADPIPHMESIVAEISGTLPAPTWVQPQGAHDAYSIGASVSHKSKKWRSLTASNVWEPGVSGWREQWSDGPSAPPPDWVQPTGAHDAYSIGDLVTFESAVYRSVINANVWSPISYPAGWEVQ